MSKHRGPRHREQGSAYIAVLLVLAVLAIIGLSLVMITETEMRIGSNERTINRSFYAVESGLGVAAARVLTTRAYKPFTYIQDEVRVGNQRVADLVDVTLMAPISIEPCDWCPRNDDGVPKFYKINHAVTAEARRVGWNGPGMPPADAKVLARRQVTVMFEFQPFDSPGKEAPDIFDPAQLSRIRF